MRSPPHPTIIRVIQLERKHLIPIHMTKVKPAMSIFVWENSPLANNSCLRQRRQVIDIRYIFLENQCIRHSLIISD